MVGGLVEQRRDRVAHMNRVGYVKSTVLGKRRKPYRRTKKPVPMALQELHDACREIFKGSGTIPSPEDVQKLSRILDNMKPEDVGLSKELQFFKPDNVVRENRRVACTTIKQCDNFSLCIFFIPAKGMIPLHNHPGMTVFSKLLLGKMHIKSYDWADPEASAKQTSQVRLARLKADDVFTAPCDTSILYPTSGGNMHEFTAITPCAVLDVIGPPYSKEEDRDCTYYKDYAYTAFPDGESAEKEEKDANGYGWLEEIEAPENARMDGIEYLGPPINESACN